MREASPALSESWSAAALAALILTGAAFSPRLIPYDMDEFVHYQPLACSAFPLSREHNLRRESCGEYDLRLPFSTTFLPLRSYLYIGSLPVLPFYPFWRLVQDPLAARLQGAVFFLLSSLLAARIVGTSPLSGLLGGLLIPPYFFSFLVDTGPVGLSVCLLLSAVLLLRGEGGALATGLAGALVFLGIFTKPVFLWVLPALGLLVLQKGRPPGGFWRSAAAVSATLVLPLLLLGFARDRDGDRYFEILRLGGVSDASESARGVLSRIGVYLFQPSSILPRSLEVPRSPADLVPILLALGLLAVFVVRRSRDSVTYLALALLTLALTALTGSASSPHHFAFFGVFLVLFFASTLRPLMPKAQLLVLGSLLVFFSSLLMRLPEAQQAPEANREKDELLAFVRKNRMDSTNVEVHTSWGTYYLSHLFSSRDQEVLYFRLREWTESPPHLAEVKALASSQGRGILVFTSRPESLTHTPAVESALGAPRARFPFGNWEAIEYLK
jgi:hypothetical protein